MHENIIVASGEDKEYIIELPHNNNILCFMICIMFNNDLIVSIVARGNYDIRYELDEQGLNLK